MSDSTIPTFTDLFEPPPPLNAGITQVVDYMDDHFTELRYSNCPDGAIREYYPLSRQAMRRICEDHCYPWQLVVDEMRRRKITSLHRGLDKILDHTPDGIPMIVEAFGELKDPFAPLCPFKQRFLSRSSFSRVNIERKCRSWNCRSVVHYRPTGFSTKWCWRRRALTRCSWPKPNGGRVWRQ